MKKETLSLHAGYEPKNGEPRVLPIYQSTTYKYDSADTVGKLFDLTADGHMYSRISNPTISAVEEKIAAMEGGVGALLASSGQSATFIALTNILGCGDHIVSSATIYGGSINLFSVTMKRFGIDVTYVSPYATREELDSAFQPNTKAVFGETLSNPSMDVLDIEKFACAAHSHNVPLIIDNTFATPILCNPFKFGADIVTHSTSKYMDGHAVQLGGAVVDGGSFDWNNGLFPMLSTPDESYHGVTYTEKFGKSAYIAKARLQMIRDLGCYPGAINAWLLNLGLETLPLRIMKHSENALAAARFLEKSDKILSVSYPKLESYKHPELVEKYLPLGASGVIAFSVNGGREAAVRFMNALKLASIVVHVADIRTCVLHPASSTHRQLTDEQILAAGINPGMIRLSVGCENIDDILEDLALGVAAL